MHERADRLVLYPVSTPDYEERGRCETCLGAARSEANHPRQRVDLQTVLHSDLMTELFVRYVRGRVFEWALGITMLFTGLELLLWDHVLTFGAFHWISAVANQKVIGFTMVLIGWFRVSALMLNGQAILKTQLGPIIRSFCAVLSGVIWAQFMLALVEISIDQGYPSVGIPLWSMLVVAELVTAYSLGAEWKRL